MYKTVREFSRGEHSLTCGLTTPCSLLTGKWYMGSGAPK